MENINQIKKLLTRQNLSLLSLFFIATAIAATVYLARQQQELRKRAEGTGLLTFVDNANPPNQITTTQSQNVRVKLTFNASGVPTTTPIPTATPGGPTTTPTPTPTFPAGAGKRVFVTSTFYDGNLGGLVDADAKCQAKADAVPSLQGGTWKAWLSSSTQSPSVRFSQAFKSAGPYRLVNGTQIAANWSSLIDGTLDHPINVTETGTVVSTGSFVAWTNTTVQGLSDPPAPYTSSSCADWTSNTPLNEDLVVGRIGAIVLGDAQWTKLAEPVGKAPCNVAIGRLYCFEQ